MPRHHHRTVIRREHPGSARRRLQWLSLLAITALAASFWAGRFTADAITVSLDDEADRQAAEIVQLQARHDIDRQTLAALRVELADNRTALAELERELAFYREVMAPEEISRGLVIRKPIFTALASPGHWRYQLIAQQGGRGNSARRGNLAVTLWGEADGVAQQYRLRDLDVELAGVEPVLNFRYFQRLEGEFTLPASFVPKHIVVTAELSKPVSEQLNQRYDWQAVTAAVDILPASVLSPMHDEDAIPLLDDQSSDSGDIPATDE